MSHRLSRAGAALLVAMGAVGALGAAAATGAGQSAAETAPPPVPIAQRGPQVGSRIPGFTLRDQLGREQDLKSLAGPHGLVLLFVRSADW
jgi:hypothetical protein